MNKIFIILFLIFGNNYALSTECNCTKKGYADLVEPLLPAIVNITKYQKNEIAQNIDQDLAYDESHNNDNEELSSFGAGFIISDNGYIVTNYHVIENFEEIIVTTADKEQYKAFIIGFDKLSDLAIIKITTKKKLPYLSFNTESNTIKIGDQILAIGNPFGLGTTISNGIISAKAKSPKNDLDDLLQVDAVINQGNSGGPLIDMTGKVIGIISSIYSPSGNNIGIGFAMPSYYIKPIISDLIKYGNFQRLDLGLSLRNNSSNEVIIEKIQENSPLIKQDVKIGDHLIYINKIQINNASQADKILSSVIGDITLTLNKGNVSKDIIIQRTQHLKQNAKISIEKKNIEEFAGITVENINLSNLEQFQANKQNYGALIVNLEKNSLAKKNGLKIGDIIIAINNQPIYDAKYFKSTLITLQKNQDFLPTILLKRADTQIFLQLPLN
jgi:serine protease Do